ncbi:hypothetical protein [Stenotrophomonas sp. 57]|uniref:hypothetical protein n=1 Tax=Stenotrophomonas sp. 57 TaxID=3051119 RepID=UPI00256E9CE9|nr:hypothetical protein [Stenotrophomonas sp. 57]
MGSALQVGSTGSRHASAETRFARALDADAELRFGAEIRDSEGNRIALQASAVL